MDEGSGEPLPHRTNSTQRSRNEVTHMCDHVPSCPPASNRQRLLALVCAPHPVQGWTLLCNGVVVFDDGGMLLPDGSAIAPPARAA